MIPLITDRTTATTDQKCGMARWWYKNEEGTGIVPVNTPDYLIDGGNIHKDMEMLYAGVPLDDVIGPVLGEVSGTNDQLALESAYRRAAWAAGVALFIRPATLAKYEVLDLEKELILDRGPLWVASTPDITLRRLEQPRYKVIRDYKSVGRLSKGWFTHWQTAIQMHIALKAEEEDSDEAPRYAEIMGLYKGNWQDGYLHHPYVWAWVEKGEWYPEYKTGRERHPVWEYPGGVVEWVQRCGQEVAAGVFPFSAPVFLDERMLDNFIESRTHREQEVQSVVESARGDRAVRAQYFEPRTENCMPTLGSACVYCAACHNAEVNKDPLGSGLYVRRQPHHEVEVIGVE